MKKMILFVIIMLCAIVGYAVDSTKPSTHNATWMESHGNAAKANQQECFSCHDDRNECISCHEDTAPRSHTSTFVNRTHGMESRWDKTSCQTCHKQDYCDSCHDTAYPMSHSRANFAEGDQLIPGSHCNASCVITSKDWKNNPAQNCIVCHKTRPVTKNGTIHP